MKRALRWVGRFVTDWRNPATAIGCVLVLLVAFVVVDAARARSDALDALRSNSEQGLDIRRAQSERISGLISEVSTLSGQVGGLSEDVRVLRRQLEQAGEKPVVSDPVTTTTVRSGNPTPRPSTPSSTTTTTSPPTTTTQPPRDEGICLPVICSR